MSGTAHDGRSRFLFILVSFEGPDRYSQAGGLGVRVAGLSETRAASGHETHVFFIGDPSLPGPEARMDGRLTLHRWSQSISEYHPGGVYPGEEGKRNDLTASLPPYLVDQIIPPAVAEGRIPIVLLEDWQTAECGSRLSDLLHTRGLRDEGRSPAGKARGQRSGRSGGREGGQAVGRSGGRHGSTRR